MKRLFRGMDCFRALRVSKWLFYGGFPCALVGCGIGYWELSRILEGVLVIGGFAAMLGGWAETIIAAKNGKQEETVGEISDLIYHLMVMMADQNIPLDAVLAELERRSHKIGNLKQMKTVDHET